MGHENIVYISTARSSEDVKDRMHLTANDEENNGAEKNFTRVTSCDDMASLLHYVGKIKKCTNADNMPDLMLKGILDADICIIDTFPYLFMEEDTGIIKSAMSLFIAISRAKRTTFLLLSDMAILTERSERLIRSMVYGRIQFRTEYVGSRISRYINIHKMQGNPPQQNDTFQRHYKRHYH